MTKTERTIDAKTTPSRKPWVDPEVTRMRATDAEAGANNIVPEGNFGLGS